MVTVSRPLVDLTKAKVVSRCRQMWILQVTSVTWQSRRLAAPTCRWQICRGDAMHVTSTWIIKRSVSNILWNPCHGERACFQGGLHPGFTWRAFPHSRKQTDPDLGMCCCQPYCNKIWTFMASAAPSLRWQTISDIGFKMFRTQCACIPPSGVSTNWSVRREGEPVKTKKEDEKYDIKSLQKNVSMSKWQMWHLSTFWITPVESKIPSYSIRIQIQMWWIKIVITGV